MRKYSSCEWCGTTTDVTNQDRDLCDTCAESPAQSYQEWIKLQNKK